MFWVRWSIVGEKEQPKLRIVDGVSNGEVRRSRLLVIPASVVQRI